MDSSYENQKIVEIEIDKEIKKSFIDYAMSVIVARALPDVRDGLKPVHRRILYAMYENGLTHEKPYKKSVATVGDVLGRYHPHGDASVYDAMVRMVQTFSLRYPLVDGQGNFGNVDGDGAAAYRYTEARMSRISEEMMTDLNKNVVNFVPNYDNKLEEPEVLPSKFPNILVNGSVGIAVGMATNIPTHNLSEVIDGVFAAMDNKDISVLELMQYIKGPDFPTYATIYGTAGIMEAYMTGRGRVMVRAKAKIEEYKNTHKIIITEIPYQVNKSNLVISIADLVKDKRVDGITGITDESGRDGMRIVIDLRRDVNPNIILNQLYKFTQMQDTCAINMIALVGGEPKTLNLKQIIEYYIEHQFTVLRRRLNFDLERAKHREHILQGLKIAIDNIDEVIRIIRANKTIAEAKAGLTERFEFSDAQAQSIVDMPLGRLSGMEIEKIIDELMRIQKNIEEICDTLASEQKLGEIIKTDLLEIKRRYGDERRTEIIPVEDEIFLEDLIDREDCIVTITKDGYIKRQTCDRYQAQRRGGKGINAMGTKEDDFVTDMFTSNSHDYLLMFTTLGRVYSKKCYELPNASRVSKGTNIVNLLELEQGEKITTIIPVTEFDKNALIMVTKKGIIKRTPLSEFERQRKSGKIAITLDEGDSLIFVGKTGGNDDITVISEDGLAIKFSERAIRVMGRQARGVRAIRLKKGVCVAGVTIVENEKDASGLPEAAELDIIDVEADIADEVEIADEPDDETDSGEDEEVIVDGNKPIMITITERGFGKRCEFEKFARRNRGGKGMLCHRLNEKTGKLIGVENVVESDDIMLITDDGTVIRTPVAGIPVYNNRASSGVIVMRLNEGSSIISFVKVKKEEKSQTDEDNDANEESTAEVSADNAVSAE